MEFIELEVIREEVYEEVDKTTDYTGSKLMDTDAGARERIAVTQTNLKDLSRFWDEACTSVQERLKEMYLGGSLPGSENFEIKLQVSVAFDKANCPGIEIMLRNYFILTITGKWFVFANKGEAGNYETAANSLMEDIRRKLYSRRMIRSPRKHREPAINRPLG